MVDNQYEVDYCKIGSVKKTMLAKSMASFVKKQKEIKTSKCQKCGKPVVILNTFPLKNVQPNHWKWNKKDKSNEVKMEWRLHRSVSIYNIPTWSNRVGASGVRGNKPLEKGGRYYWEVVARTDFLIDIKVGISTRKASLKRKDTYGMYVLGRNDQSWVLTETGSLWHNRNHKDYTRPFYHLRKVIIGVLFDSNEGTLTYFKNGTRLGVAFRDLDKVEEELFPTVSSDADEIIISIKKSVRDFTDLQDRCRAVILSNLRNRKKIDSLPLPNVLKEYIHLSLIHI